MVASRTSRSRHSGRLRRNSPCAALFIVATGEDGPKRRPRARRDDAPRPLPAGTREIAVGAVDAHNARREDAARLGAAVNREHHSWAIEAVWSQDWSDTPQPFCGPG